jgi:hypothetical protein
MALEEKMYNVYTSLMSWFRTMFGIARQDNNLLNVLYCPRKNIIVATRFKSVLPRSRVRSRRHEGKVDN